MQALPARSSQKAKNWPDKITELKIAAHAMQRQHLQKCFYTSKKTLQKQMRDIHYKNDIIYIFGKEKRNYF